MDPLQNRNGTSPRSKITNATRSSRTGHGFSLVISWQHHPPRPFPLPPVLHTMVASAYVPYSPQSTAQSALTLPARGNATGMLSAAACEFIWRGFDELAHSFAYFNRDAGDHFAFRGTRLGGSDHPGEPFDQLDEGHGTAGLIASSDGQLRVGECTTPAEDGGLYHTQRIGPFSSVGGYDWWNIYHRDFGTVQRELDRLPKGHQLGITAHVAGAVTATGELIGNPPIHTHHVHIVPGVGEEYLMPTTAGGLDCYLRSEHCWDMSVAIQQTGDSQCMSEDGGTECFGHDYGDHIKLIGEPLAIAAQLNDVRPTSPTAPLVWWYQVVLRTETVGPEESADSKKRPLSVHAVSQPISIDVPPSLDNLAAIELPINADSFIYYTGRMPFAGALAGVDWHTYALRFQSSLLAAAAPRHLGLDGAVFQPTDTRTAITTATTGLIDNAALRKHMLNTLAVNAARSVTSTSTPLICEWQGRTEAVGGARFDRASTASCRPWTFAEGEQFTIAAFCGPRASENEGVQVAPVPERAGAFFYFEAADERSHFTIQEYSHTIDAVGAVASRSDGLRTLLHGGTPQAPPSWADRIAIAVLLLFLFIVDVSSNCARHPAAALALCAALAALAATILYRHGLRRWRALLLAVASSLYFLFIVIPHLFLVPEHVWLVNRNDAEGLTARQDRTEALAAKAILLAFGAGLVAAMLREWERSAPEELKPMLVPAAVPVPTAQEQHGQQVAPAVHPEEMEEAEAGPDIPIAPPEIVSGEAVTQEAVLANESVQMGVAIETPTHEAVAAATEAVDEPEATPANNEGNTDVV